MTGVTARTPDVLTANVALVAPAGTLTLAGTVSTAGRLLVSVVMTPPAGAGAVSVMVPTAEAPPTTELTFTPTEATAGGVTVSVAALVLPLKAALIVTGVAVVTVEVFTGKVALVVPPRTVMLTGIMAIEGAPLASVTTVSAGALPFSITVPVEVTPEATDAGFRVTEAAPKGTTVSVADTVLL